MSFYNDIIAKRVHEENISDYYVEIENFISNCFYEINNIKDLEASEIQFKKLDKMHLELSILKYKNSCNYNERIDNFLYDFERIDDFETKKSLFNKIINNKYWW